MAAARTDAGLVESVDGRLVGILTDSDVSIKVAASGRSLRTTLVEDVMTPNPLCVRSSEGADKALALMAEKRARHLPLLDAEGSLSGMLSISKVLYDAITRLEKSKGDSQNFYAQYFPAMNRMVGGEENGKIPTLAEALESRPPPATARPRDPIAVALNGLRTTRRSVLVLDEAGKLVGILSKSDVAKRALRTALSVDAALGADAELNALNRLTVRDCMTPRPDVMQASRTVLDALHKMHDGKFANLPIVDDNDNPVGVVDVLDLLSMQKGDTRSEKTSSFSEMGDWVATPTSSSESEKSTTPRMMPSLLENFFAVTKPQDNVTLDTAVQKAEPVYRGGHYPEGLSDAVPEDSGDQVVVQRITEEEDDDNDIEDAVVVERVPPAVVMAKPASHLPTGASVTCAISPSTLKHSKTRDGAVGSIDVFFGKTRLVTVAGDAPFDDLKAAVLTALPDADALDLEYSDDLCPKLIVLDDASLRAAAALGHAHGLDLRLTVVHVQRRSLVPLTFGLTVAGVAATLAILLAAKRQKFV